MPDEKINPSKTDPNIVSFGSTNNDLSPIKNTGDNPYDTGIDLSGSHASLKDLQEFNSYFGSSETIPLFEHNTYNDIAASQQGLAGDVLKTVKNVGSKVVAETLKLPGYLAAGVTGLTGNGFDNIWLQKVDEANEWFKNLTPSYMSSAVQEGGILGKLTNSAWWANTGADGIGFMASMMIPGEILKALSLGEKLESVLKAGSTLTDAEKVAEITSIGNQATKYSSKLLSKLPSTIDAAKIDSGIAVGTNTLLESLGEANNTYRDLRQKYIDSGMDETQANNLAGNAAAKVFGLNLPILLASNFLVEKYILKGFGTDPGLEQGNRLLRAGDNMFKAMTGQELKIPTKLSRDYLKNQSLNFISSALREGLYEEGLQTTLQQYMENNPDASWSDAVTGTFNQFWKDLTGLEGDAQSKEFYESTVLGSILGGGMSTLSVHNAHNETKDFLLGSPEKQAKQMFGYKMPFSKGSPERKGAIANIKEAYEKDYKDFQTLYDLKKLSPDEITDLSLIQDKNEQAANYVRQMMQTNAAINEATENKLPQELVDHFINDNRTRLASRLINAGIDEESARSFYTKAAENNDNLKDDPIKVQEDVEQNMKSYDTYKSLSDKINATHNIRNYPIENYSTDINQFMEETRSEKLGRSLRLSNIENTTQRIEAKMNNLLETSKIEEGSKLFKQKMNEVKEKYPELVSNDLIYKTAEELAKDEDMKVSNMKPEDKALYEEYKKMKTALDEEYKIQTKELNKLYSTEGMNKRYKEFTADNKEIENIKKSVEDNTFNTNIKDKDKQLAVNTKVLVDKLEKAGTYNPEQNTLTTTTFTSGKNNYILEPTEKGFQIRTQKGKYVSINKDGKFSINNGNKNSLSFQEAINFISSLDKHSPVEFHNIDSDQHLSILNSDAHKQKIIATKAAIETIKRNINEYKDRVEKHRNIVQKAIDLINNKEVETHKHFLDKKIKELEELTEQVKRKRKPELIQELNNKIADLKNEVDEYEKILDLTHAPLNELEQTLTKLNNDLSIVNEELKGLQSLLHFSNESVNPLKALRSSILSSFDAVDTFDWFSILDNKDKAVIDKKLLETVDKINETRTKIEEVKKLIENKRNEYKEVKAKLQELSKLLTDSNNSDDIEALKNKLEEIKNEGIAATEELKKLNEIYKEYNAISRIITTDKFKDDLDHLVDLFNKQVESESKIANKKLTTNPFSLTGLNIDYTATITKDGVVIKDKKGLLSKVILDSQKAYYDYLYKNQDSITKHTLKLFTGESILNNKGQDSIEYKLLQQFRTAWGDKFDEEMFKKGKYAVLYKDGKPVIVDNTILNTAFRDPSSLKNMNENVKKGYTNWFNTVENNTDLKITGFTSQGHVVYLHDEHGNIEYVNLDRTGEYMPNMKISKTGYESNGEELVLAIVDREGKVYAFDKNNRVSYNLPSNSGRPALVSKKGGSGKMILLKAKLISELENKNKIVNSILYLLSQSTIRKYSSKINDNLIFSDSEEKGLMQSIIPFGGDTNFKFEKDTLHYGSEYYNLSQLNTDLETYFKDGTITEDLQKLIDFIGTKEFNIDRKTVNETKQLQVPVYENGKFSIRNVNPYEFYFDKLKTNVANFRAQLNITFATNPNNNNKPANKAKEVIKESNDNALTAAFKNKQETTKEPIVEEKTNTVSDELKQAFFQNQNNQEKVNPALIEAFKKKGEEVKEPNVENIEDEKADIEKRRVEELLGNLTPLNFETTDTKGRVRKTIIQKTDDKEGFKYTFETTVEGVISTTNFPKTNKEKFKKSSIYENLDPDSKDFIDELPEDSIISLEDIAISTNKNSAAGLGNGRITIGYTSKSESIVLHNIILKYKPNKINAKYDAELASLENKETESEIKPETNSNIEELNNLMDDILNIADNNKKNNPFNKFANTDEVINHMLETNQLIKNCK